MMPPKGRPKGSGALGHDTCRLTVRLPLSLYQRLTAYACGRSAEASEAELSPYVREAIAAYIDQKTLRRTEKYSV